MNRATCGSLVLVLTVSSSGPVVAQRGLPFSPKGGAKLNSASNDSRQIRAEAERLAKARRELTQQEQAAISQALEQLAAAKVAHRAAGKDLTATKEKTLDGIEASLGLKRAQEDLARAQAEYDSEARPVVEKLKTSTEYVDAEKKSVAAKAALRELQSDALLSESEKKSRRQGLAGESMTAANLEQLTLQKNDRVVAARERVDAARKTVGELKRKATEKAEKDSAVTAAHEAVTTAFAAVKSAEANLASVQSNAAAAEHLLQAGVVPRTGDQGGKGKNDGKGKK